MKLILYLFICFIFTLNLNAQQKGKISGSVTDEKTGESLIGASIVVDGTSQGAITDVNGRYFILGINPGTYSLTVSMIGYGKIKKTKVEVFIDRTTEVNFRLKDEAVQLQTVVVNAEKPMIIKDQTSSASTMDDEQLKVAPISGIRGALDLTSSFQKNETGDYTVRGSGAYEVNFQINGVQQVNSSTSAPGSFASNKADNSWKYDVNPVGVQQIQMITGGFSAEYGNAQAGVVKVVMKEGQPKFNGEVRWEYRPEGQYHYGTYIYDKSNFEWQKWGSLDYWKGPGRLAAESGLKFANRYEKLKSDSAKYNELLDKEIEWAYNLWVANHTPSEDNPFGVYDYRTHTYSRFLFGFGGPLGKDPNILRFYFSGEYKKNPTRLPTAEQDQITQNYTLNVSYQVVKDHKLKLMSSFQRYQGGIWSGSEDIRWAGLPFSGLSQKYYIKVDPVRTEQTITQSLNYIYTIDTKSFLEANATYQYETYKLPYEFLIGTTQMADRLDSLSDPVGVILLDGPWYENNYFRPPLNVSTNYYQDNRTSSYNFGIDYTNQILPTNLLKTGLRFTYWDMVNNGVNSSFQANTYLVRSGFAEYYKAFPINASFYFQDKMEYEGMIANFGLRGEAYNFQTGVPIDEFNIFYQGASGPGKLGNPEKESSEWKFILLPRLGISFPIGSSTAFRLQYGHFASMPIFSQALSQRTQSGWTGYGNPNLDPKTTISYEFGLQQALNEDHRLDLVIFYNDRTSQIGTRSVASYTGSRDRPAGFANDGSALFAYTTFDNNSFGSSIGFELIFEKAAIGDWTYRLSYSFSQTKDGNFGASIKYPDDRTTAQRSFTGEFLSSSDRMHNFSGMLQYRIQQNGGFDIFGFKPFSNSTFSLTYKAQSGLPFTYVKKENSKNETQLITSSSNLNELYYLYNNRRYPLEARFDFNFQKNFELFGFSMILGVKVLNLFNNKWVTPMDLAEDLIYWMEKGVTIDNTFSDTRYSKSNSNIVADFRAYRNMPRQIFITLGLGF